MEKVCRTCSTPKPIGCFEPIARGKTRNSCRSCVTQRQKLLRHTKLAEYAQKSRAYYLRNQEARKATQRQWNSANRASVSVKKRAYRIKNLDAIKASGQRRYAEHSQRIRDAERNRREERSELVKQRVRDRMREWMRNNPEACRAAKHRRRAREKGAEGSHAATEIKLLYGEQSGQCARCRTNLNGKYHVDHIVPISKGGPNWITNIQLLCPPCNLSKGAKLPEELPLVPSGSHSASR